MFDDQQPQPGSPSSSKKAAPPEDIFAGVDATPAVAAPTQASKPASTDSASGRAPDRNKKRRRPKKKHKRAEDVPAPAPTNPMLSSKGDAPIPPGLGEGETFSTPPQPVAPSPAAIPASSGRSSHGRAAKKMVIIGVIVILVIVAAVLLASLILRSRKAVSPLSQPPAEETTVKTPIEDLISNPGELIPGVGESPALENDLLLGGDPEPEPERPDPDSDRDGLTDAEEAALGTSPRAADTDNDGLSDRDEVKQWGTNPLNPDSDGDTFLDGEEVDNGYNPKGAGRLFEIPTE